MNYTTISLDTWPRRDIFRHFINDLRCIISITSEIDVSRVIYYCKKNNYDFYPIILYIITKSLNKRDEFKIGYDVNGNLILWDYISPSHIDFNLDDELVTRLVTEFIPDIDLFHKRVRNDMDSNKQKRGFEIEYNIQNTFDASCIPWINYSSCELHVFNEGTYLRPIITWGKYEKKNGKVMMPLTMRIHHAVADAFHISRFYSDVENEILSLSTM